MSIGGGGGGSKPKESKYDQELARIRDQEWQKYKVRFPQHDRRMIAEARAMDTGARREEARGVAASSIQQRRPVARPGAGLDPSSGRFQSAVGGDTTARGAGMADGMASADLQQTSGYLGRMMGAVKLGRDIGNQGTQGLNRLASMETSRNISDAYASAREDAATGEALGTAAGFGLQRYRQRDRGGDSFVGAGTKDYHRTNRSVINTPDPGVRDYWRQGGYRGGGF